MARGSSPLARGTPYRAVEQAGYGGLIPARAGNTASSSRMAPMPRAHPRSRGEHIMSSTPVGGFTGSSPLARGTLCMQVRAS